MSVNDIPDECLNEPHFIQVLVGSLLSDAACLKKTIADGEMELKEIKVATVGVELEQRNHLKKAIEEHKQRLALSELTAESLTFTERHLSEELNELRESLDSDSLKTEQETKVYEEILNEYKSTWENYKDQYECMEFAVERKKERIISEKLKIRLMTSEYKRKEHLKMLKQRKAIDQMRIQTKILEMSKLLRSRWERQDYHSQLKCNVFFLSNELKKIENKRKNMRKEIEEQERISMLARQQMPPPRLDISFVRSFYSEPRPNYQYGMQRRKSFNSDLDSDSISIDSVIIRELCQSEDNVLMKTDRNTEQAEKMKEKSPSFDERNSEKRTNSSNVATLETCYRQLSIEKKKCEETHVDEMMHNDEGQKVIEAPQKIRESVEKVSKDTKENNHLESPKKIEEVDPRVPEITIHHEKRLHSSENHQFHQDYEPEPKKNKLEENDSMDINNMDNKLDTRNEKPNESIRQLPQVRKVENVTYNMNVTKPVVEIAQKMSKSFLPHDYNPSYVSNDDDMSTVGDSEFDENRGPYGLDLQQNRNIPMDFAKIPSWMNTSQSGSQSSFRSDVSAIKNFHTTENNFSKNDQSVEPGTIYDRTIIDKILTFTFHILVIIYFFRLELFQLFLYQ